MWKQTALGKLLMLRRPGIQPGDQPESRVADEQPEHRSTVFVLSGGGHLGALQVGQLQALHEFGITADAYVACSVGALNAAVMAALPGPAGIEQLHGIWRQTRTDEIFPGNTVQQMWRVARRHDHLYSSAGLVRLIMSVVPATHFHNLQVPLRIVATELETGEERLFGAGPLLRPLLATAALPGVFPPVRIGNRTYVDGGIVNNVPISHATSADRVVVLQVHDAPTIPPTSSFGVLLRSFQIARANRFRVDIEHYSRETELIIFPQVELPEIRFPDLSHSEELMELGYRRAVAFLQDQGKPITEALAPVVDLNSSKQSRVLSYVRNRVHPRSVAIR